MNELDFIIFKKINPSITIKNLSYYLIINDLNKEYKYKLRNLKLRLKFNQITQNQSKSSFT